MESVESSRKSKYECLLFDMDDTLYPLSAGLNVACRKNIEDYMMHHLKMERSEVPRMCLELYKEHGTTMAGLKALDYEFDNDEFHKYVHGRLPYELLKPDPVLRNLLLSIPQRKIIFTNADKAHVAQVLSKLGLEDCFEGVICFETLNPPIESKDDDKKADATAVSNDSHSIQQDDLAFFTASDAETNSTESTEKCPFQPTSQILCKPSLKAMEAAIQIANIDPKKTIFFDDSTRNIATGKLAGFHTVIVGSSVLTPGADVALSSIHNIKEALPEIWEDEEGEHLEQVLAPRSVVTVVNA
ncbi:HAD-like domain-containing protein [Cinnamomum micranthum f. kanehirae]|uniref:HAD-like domain-containing protein n=1 Tax=Cinnamomum micranthum f. kanehirae TaxID=337451 RepID=A0A3S3NHB3_9MAGN|nr:HAD-like domain-containing protein [Cinnamomum micranthum f. kanehirae]